MFSQATAKFLRLEGDDYHQLTPVQRAHYCDKHCVLLGDRSTGGRRGEGGRREVGGGGGCKGGGEGGREGEACCKMPSRKMSEERPQEFNLTYVYVL